MQALEPADFVVEAINEDESSKKAAFLLLDQVPMDCSCGVGKLSLMHAFMCIHQRDVAVALNIVASAMLLVMQIVKPEAILASNTSSISITRIAAVTKRSSQVVKHNPLLQWYALHCHSTTHAHDFY